MGDVNYVTSNTGIINSDQVSLIRFMVSHVIRSCMLATKFNCSIKTFRQIYRYSVHFPLITNMSIHFSPQWTIT